MALVAQGWLSSVDMFRWLSELMHWLWTAGWVVYIGVPKSLIKVAPQYCN